jgi:hypothetical protein
MLLSYFLLLTFAIARLVFHSIPFFLLFFGIRDVALPLGQLLSSSGLLFHIDGRRPLYEYNEVSCGSAPSYRVGVIVSFVLLFCSSFLFPLLFYSDAAEIFFTSSRIPFTSAFSVVFTQTRSAVNCSALLLSNPRCI